LAEYGIPSSAIRKMESSIPADLPEDVILSYIKQRQLFDLPSIIDYEKKKIQKNIN
jgi:hypothetical protein